MIMNGENKYNAIIYLLPYTSTCTSVMYFNDKIILDNDNTINFSVLITIEIPKELENDEHEFSLCLAKTNNKGKYVFWELSTIKLEKTNNKKFNINSFRYSNRVNYKLNFPKLQLKDKGEYALILLNDSVGNIKNKYNKITKDIQLSVYNFTVQQTI